MDKRKKKNHGAEDDINAFESEDYSMEHYSKTGSLSNNFNANEIELDFTSLDVPKPVSEKFENMEIDEAEHKYNS